MSKLNLDHREGRSEKAAKLHSVAKASRQLKAARKAEAVFSVLGNILGQDYWSERGEQGRWVRVHATPRQSMFSPGEVARGPGSKTRLRPERVVQGFT